MFFLPALNALSSCRVFHSANIAELEEAFASRPGRKDADRDAHGNEKRFSGEPPSKSNPVPPALTKAVTKSEQS